MAITSRLISIILITVSTLQFTSIVHAQVSGPQPDTSVVTNTSSGVDSSNTFQMYEAYSDEVLVQKLNKLLNNENSQLKVESLHFDLKVMKINFIADPSFDDRNEREVLFSKINNLVNDYLTSARLSGNLSFIYELALNGKLFFGGENSVANENKGILGTESTTGIAGKRIVLSPGHGWTDSGSGTWYLQRGYYYGIVEDFINAELVMELYSKLGGYGADIRTTRQMSKNAGSHSSGHPWWEMNASEYIRSLGAPESIWKPYNLSGNDRDIRSRPEYANWVGANAMISVHNNGGGSTYCNSHGTETWYDTLNAYSSQSYQLANVIHTKLIQRLRSQWDPNWCDRGVKGANGNYGENRWFNGPAALVELAFVDVKSDNDALQNATFRSIATSAIADAIVEYYGGATPPPCPMITSWKGEYWNNRSFSGSPSLCRNDVNLDFNWGTGGPGSGIPNDNFSARWTRTMYFNQGTYRFRLAGDDGIRLWIDGNLVIDQWKDQGHTEYPVERTLSAGNHEFKVEYYENGGDASVSLNSEVVGSSCSNDAQFLAQSSYLTVAPGQSFNIFFELRNSGTCTWRRSDNYYLSFIQGNSMNANTRQELTADVSPNTVYRWNINGMIAPTTPGVYQTWWRATQNGTSFGPWMYIQVTVQQTSSNNLALDKASWATSQESASYPAKNGNDGNGGTRWSSQASSSLGWQWFRVDLGSAQTFNRFIVRWENAYAAKYWVAWCDVDCTSDNSTWYGYERTLSSRQDDVFSFSPETHRYVGILMTQRAPLMNNYSFFELEVYNAASLYVTSSDFPDDSAKLMTSPQEVPSQPIEPEPIMMPTPNESVSLEQISVDPDSAMKVDVTITPQP